MGLVEIAVSTSADQALKEMMEALDKEKLPVAPSQTTAQNPKGFKKSQNKSYSYSKKINNQLQQNETQVGAWKCSKV